VKEYLYNYIKEIDNLINSNKKINDDVINNHLIKINFFQHERLIHLLVTMMVTIVFIIIFLFSISTPFNIGFFLLDLILVILLGFYYFHYYFLENSVQHMYRQRDAMKEIIDKK
jgi:uncharacterized membrane protein